MTMDRNLTYPLREYVYDKALEHYGWDTQAIIAVEELSEAQKEICKFFRCEGNMEHMAEEVADAFIMLEQVERIFHIKDKVTEYMAAKIDRLSAKIDRERRGTDD